MQDYPVVVEQLSTTRYIFATLGILLLTSLAYAGVYWADFVYEDGNATGFGVVQPMPIAPLRVRALTRVSYRIDRVLGDGSPRMYHLTNVGLHLTNGVLVGAIAVTIIPASPAAAPAAALVAMAVFLGHPLQTEAVSYVAGRTELLSTLFILAACLLVLRGGVGRWNWLAVGVLLLLAMSAKESAICGIGLVGLCTWQRHGLNLAGVYPVDLIRKYWRPGLIAAIPVIGLCASVYWYEYRPVGHSPLGRWHYAALQASAFWRYVAMLPYPFGQTVDHDFELIPIWRQGLALAGLICAYALIWLGWVVASVLRTEDYAPIRLMIFCANWVLLSVILRFVIRIPETLNEHQIYLWMAGVSWGIAGIAHGVDQRIEQAIWQRETKHVLDPVNVPVNAHGDLDFETPSLDW